MSETHRFGNSSFDGSPPPDAFARDCWTTGPMRFAFSTERETSFLDW